MELRKLLLSTTVLGAAVTTGAVMNHVTAHADTVSPAVQSVYANTQAPASDTTASQTQTSAEAVYNQSNVSSSDDTNQAVADVYNQASQPVSSSSNQTDYQATNNSESADVQAVYNQGQVLASNSDTQVSSQSDTNAAANVYQPAGTTTVSSQSDSDENQAVANVYNQSQSNYQQPATPQTNSNDSTNENTAAANVYNQTNNQPVSQSDNQYVAPTASTKINVNNDQTNDVIADIYNGVTPSQDNMDQYDQAIQQANQKMNQVLNQAKVNVIPAKVTPVSAAVNDPESGYPALPSNVSPSAYNWTDARTEAGQSPWETTDQGVNLHQTLHNGNQIYYYNAATGDDYQAFDDAVNNWNRLGVINLVAVNANDAEITLSNDDDPQDNGYSNYGITYGSTYDDGTMAGYHSYLDHATDNSSYQEKVNTATHELGHALGFDHDENQYYDENGSGHYTTHIMYSGQTDEMLPLSTKEANALREHYNL